MGFIDDSKEVITCPACGEEMVKVFSEEANVCVDICVNGCGGMFFDNRELEKFDEQHENADEILNAVKDKEFKKVEQSETRICPICNIPMVKQGSLTDVEIDICNVCGGKFLDNGELEKIRNKEKDEKKLDWTFLDPEIPAKGSAGRAARRKFFENIIRKTI